MQPLPDADPSPYQSVTRISSQLSSPQRLELTEYLLEYVASENAEIHKTHFFDGRYENIYLDRSVHPTLDQIVKQAQFLASGLLHVAAHDLAVGFWLNIMPPGSSTTLHRHDDMDELLSAVFYLMAPARSGCLEIHESGRVQKIEPIEGDFLFFSPQLPHAVSENHSQLTRFSIAMNFGPRQQSI